MKRQPTEWEKVTANDTTNDNKKNSSYNSTSKKQTTQLRNRQKTQTFFKKRHTDGQQAHEKMLNIANHQRNAC